MDLWMNTLRTQVFQDSTSSRSSNHKLQILTVLPAYMSGVDMPEQLHSG